MARLAESAGYACLKKNFRGVMVDAQSYAYWNKLCSQSADAVVEVSRNSRGGERKRHGPRERVSEVGQEAAETPAPAGSVWSG